MVLQRIYITSKRCVRHQTEIERERQKRADSCQNKKERGCLFLLEDVKKYILGTPLAFHFLISKKYVSTGTVII